jgi:thioredoxin-related protein
MKKTVFYIILLGFVCGLRAGGDNWVGFDRGLALSQKQGKPMLVDFYTDWCHWCKVMDEKTFGNPKVKAFLESNFVSVRIQAEDKNAFLTYKGKKYNHVEFSRAAGVKGFPSLAFFDKKGELITIIPGYVPAETFLPILKYIKQECYAQKISFEDFLKKQDECDKKKSRK